MKTKDLIKELKHLNNQLLCQIEKKRQRTMELELSLSSHQHKTQQHNTSHSAKSSIGSKKDEDDSVAR